MQALELLAPARNKEIGIAAIDCGADAVYIAGPDFGARKAAGNSFEDIAELCTYAHRFGVKVFVTYNTLWREGEEEEAHAQMLRAQEAGADAFIIREPRIAAWDDITVPIHASTQCAIRDVERARLFESLGCERIILALTEIECRHDFLIIYVSSIYQPNLFFQGKNPIVLLFSALHQNLWYLILKVATQSFQK